jgi:hypothetical protein
MNVLKYNFAQKLVKFAEVVSNRKLAEIFSPLLHRKYQYILYCELHCLEKK